MTETCDKGVLLLHTGSPEAPTPEAVRRYLKRFLMDPYVLTMPRPLRCLLVHGIIAPTRARASAEKYATIWMPEGSPLVVLTERFRAALQERMPDRIVAVGSAYGTPSTAAAVKTLLDASVRTIAVLPMFPHFAGATRGSMLATLDMALAQSASTPDIAVVPPFYQEDAYIQAVCGAAAAALQEFTPDHVLFSYHGLPVRQGRAAPSDGSVYTYEEQCERTTAALIAALNLDPARCGHAYQSRFGRGWLEPMLEEELVRLARAGCRRLAVFAPSFVTDCLETLEELDMRAREQFLAAGGEAFLRFPALNDDPRWVDAAAEMIHRMD